MNKNNILIKEKEKSFSRLIPLIALVCLIQTAINFLISRENSVLFVSLFEDFLVILAIVIARLGNYKYYDKVLYGIMPISLAFLSYRIFLEGGLVVSSGVLWFPVFPLVAAYFTNKKFTYFLQYLVSISIIVLGCLYYSNSPASVSMYAIGLFLCSWVTTIMVCKYEEQREKTAGLMEDKNRKQMLLSSYYGTAQVIQGFAHEVNNPLCITLLSLQNLELSGKLTPEELRELEDSIGRIKDLIGNLKVRIDTQSPKVTSPQAPAYETVTEVIGFFNKIFTEHNIKVLTNLKELKNRPISLKELEMFEATKQIVQNAVENCIQRADSREIHFKYYKDIKQLHIWDNGPEFDEKLCNQHDSFYSTKKGHSGLGLSIAKELFKINNIKLILTSQQKGKVILQFS